MIPKLENYELMTNAKNESAFRIQATAKTFSLLSDKIYTHKVAAVVREICCNAIDSHIEAWKSDVPIVITFPNQIDPKFSVEDFGVGLDDEQVRDIYTVYGASTKTASNDVIGALGIGSKSPFAYTKTFSIRARKDGFERTYNAYTGTDGSPRINLIGKSRTEECNGVKITIPVKEADFSKFYAEAAFIMSFFKTPPDVRGYPYGDFKFIYPGIYHELEKDFFVMKDKANHDSQLYQGEIYAVMGGVCYAVNKSDVFDKDNKDDKRTLAFLNYILKKQVLFLKFEMGSIDFAPSREMLSLDEDTLKVLRSRFDQHIERRFGQDQKYIDTLNVLQALDFVMSKYGIIFQGNMYNYNEEYKASDFFNWRGKPLTGYYRKKSKLHRIYNVDFFHRGSRVNSDDGQRNFFQVGNLIKTVKIVAIYPEVGESGKGSIAMGIEISEESGYHEKVISFKTPLSEAKRKRIEKLFYGIPVEWKNLKEERKNRKAKKTVEGEKLEKAEVKCRCNTVDDYHKYGHSEVCNLDSNEFTYVYIDEDEPYKYGDADDDDGVYGLFLSCLTYEQKQKLIVMRPNKASMPKVIKYGIQKFDDYVDGFLKNNQDILKKSIKVGMFHDVTRSGTAYNVSSDGHIASLVDKNILSDVNLDKNEIIYLNSLYVRLDSLSYNRKNTLPSVIMNEYNKYKGIMQKIYDYYPLTAYIKIEEKYVDDDVLEQKKKDVAEYIEMVNADKGAPLVI